MAGEIALVLGTRPEIIKLSPVVRACREQDVPCTIVHTGQHYSDSLDAVFFDQLGLPDPDYDLGVGSGPHGEQTGEMMAELGPVLRAESPDAVLVQGDTNSVLAGALVASKLDVTLGHVEAGLRSYDRGMPEEINRVVADHVSEHLFAPTDRSEANLLEEGIPESRVSVTGNTVVDALEHNRRLARRRSDVLAELGLDGRSFFLLTLHREENVDDAERFRGLLAGAGRAGREHDVPVVYPVHPRARTRIREFDIDVPDPIAVVEPREYLAFLRLEDEASLVLTDSGGVQEEACILGTPCVTLRDSTERPETLAVGANVLADPATDPVTDCVDRMLGAGGGWDNPFGDGRAGERIVRTVASQERGVGP
jgi:UDP-N-acetylglucosamine 2-epimerase (non-hydrolysing)